MPKKLPYLPRFALAIIIVLALLAAAMALNLAIAEGQEIKRRPPDDALIAYLTDPDSPLTAPAQVPAGTALKFHIVPASDAWKLQYYGADKNWHCVDWLRGVTYGPSIRPDPELGSIITFGYPSNRIFYLRGAVPNYGAGCTQQPAGQSVPDDDMRQITAIMPVTWGTAPQNPGPTPPGYGAAPDGIDSIDTLIYQAPGGDWVAQMMVSVGAAVVIMAILRSMVGLIAGIGAMPISAYGMAAIGYGSYWYVTVMVLIFVLAVAAFATIIRRPGG